MMLHPASLLLLLPMSSVACGAPAGAAAPPLPRSVVKARPRRRPEAHLAVAVVAHARLPGVLSMPPRTTTESLRTTTASPQLPPPCLMVMPPRPSSCKLRRADSDSDDDDRRVAHKEESDEMDEPPQQQVTVCVAAPFFTSPETPCTLPTAQRTDAPEAGVAASV